MFKMIGYGLSVVVRTTLSGVVSILSFLIK